VPMNMPRLLSYFLWLYINFWNLQKLERQNNRECIEVEANRVKQILSSSADVEVKYNGVSVWIDSLNDDERTATVHLRGPLEERSTVEIHELKEE
jgi:small acid-soluble spore protein H (minor)